MSENSPTSKRPNMPPSNLSLSPSQPKDFTVPRSPSVPWGAHVRRCSVCRRTSRCAVEPACVEA